MTMTFNREGLLRFGATYFEPKVNSSVRKKLLEVEAIVMNRIAKVDYKCESEIFKLHILFNFELQLRKAMKTFGGCIAGQSI